MTRDPDTEPGEDPIVGDPDGIRIDEGEEFDYALTRPDGAAFGFDAVEIPDLRELLEDMQGDG
ncbi:MULTISPECIES: hypothetical protein [Halorussus]|uniref:hypothetical protein n=1 Tax=Halorussus TaxID=1070314 RepID=UPI000E20EA34|nr:MULTISPECIES: hypothetical protein [Halorussus]NHN60304.1 hypothetical protein [Halorussus sp. JP-T4]